MYNSVFKNNLRLVKLLFEDNFVTNVKVLSKERSLNFTSEIVFNTSHTGYEEIVTDPSYAGQSVLFTYPHIGNTGINFEDWQSDKIWVDSVFVRELELEQSNYRSKISFYEFMLSHNIPIILDIDTRYFTNQIRKNGSMNIRICDVQDVNNPVNVTSVNKNYLEEVSSKEIIVHHNNSIESNTNICVYDFGVKRSILKELSKRFSKVYQLPYNTPIEKLSELKPDGIVLSNGPGDPREYLNIIELVKKILKLNIPIFGICLGHQLISLALGLNIFKMKFGHHGANHPIKDFENNKISISSQNHNYSTSNITNNKTSITSTSLFDNSVQSINHTDYPMITIQGHPEGSPGPNDLCYYFDRFLEMVISRKL